MRHRHPLRTSLLPVCALLACGLSLAGCSGSDNPAAPGGGNEEDPILTPRYLKIESIGVAGFGDKNGGSWDASLVVADRRADLYVTLGAGTSVNAPIYVSDVQRNASEDGTYAFRNTADGAGLPKSIAVTRRVYLAAYDDDGALNADDEIGTAHFEPLDLVPGDNSTHFNKQFDGSNSTTFVVVGSWVY